MHSGSEATINCTCTYFYRYSVSYIVSKACCYDARSQATAAVELNSSVF
jgi:hypothetical protein